MFRCFHWLQGADLATAALQDSVGDLAFRIGEQPGSSLGGQVV